MEGTARLGACKLTGGGRGGEYIYFQKHLQGTMGSDGHSSRLYLQLLGHFSSKKIHHWDCHGWKELRAVLPPLGAKH